MDKKNFLEVLGEAKTLEFGAARIEDIKNEIKQFQDALDTKANEVVHTTNTGAWEELIPTNVLNPEILDLIPQYSMLLPKLPWNHGTNMAISEKVALVGEASIFEGNSEWTTGSAYPADPTAPNISTGSITISQGQFKLDVAISRRELNYSIGQLESTVRDRLNRSAARTIDAVIINGDSATSGNVNFDGGTPAATSYYLEVDWGIREVAISDSNTHNVGTLDDQDFLDMLDLVGDYAAEIGNLLFILPRNVYNKALGLTNLKTYDKAENQATILSGILANIYGVDMLVHRDMPALAQATGKVSNTGGSNTVGQFALIYKPAVQYGYGQVVDIELTRVAGKGIMLTATFEFGFAIAYEDAGLDKTVALWINVTV